VKLHELSDYFYSHMRVLLSIGNIETIAGCIIIQVFSQKLDLATQTTTKENNTIMGPVR